MASLSLLTDYDLTLFQMSFSRSLRVTWLATELGIIHEINVKHVPLMEGAQYTPEFQALNKMSAVPTLLLKHKATHQQIVLSESAAICMFLTDQIEGGARLKPDPSNLLACAAYAKFVVFGPASIDPLLWAIRTHEELLPEEKRAPSVAAMARMQFVEKIVPTLESVLKTTASYLCEPYHQGFTTADIVVGYSLYWAQAKYGLLDNTPILREYLQRLMGREQFELALKFKPPTMKL